jgi:hypothetical protein
MPSKLYALKLHKIDIAAMVGVLPDELADAQLAKACSTDEGKAGDIVSLKDCYRRLSDMSCLVGLEQMQELDISGCATAVADSVAEVIAAHK